MTSNVVFSLLILVTLTFVNRSEGHGYLRDPPSRSSMWRQGFNVPQNYNDNGLNCGGNRVKCGVCGDPPTAKQDNLAGGKYASGIISRNYTEGQTIKSTVVVTANHVGWFEFHLCVNNDVSRQVTEQCLMSNVLELASGGTRYQLQKSQTGPIDIDLKLPPGVTCDQCVIRWKWMTGNSWGTDADGNSCVGCGDHQEQFYGCSDVRIASQGGANYNPNTPRPTQRPVYPVNTQAPTRYPVYPVNTQRPTQNPGYPVNTQRPYPIYPVNTQAPTRGPFYPQNTQAPYNPYPVNTQAPYNPYNPNPQNTQAPYNPYNPNPQNTQAPYNPYNPIPQNTQAPYNPYNPNPQNTQAPYNPYNPYRPNTQAPYNPYNPNPQNTLAPYNPLNPYPLNTQAPYNPYNPYQQNTQAPYNPYRPVTNWPVYPLYTPAPTRGPFNPYGTQSPYNPYNPQVTQAPYNPYNPQVTQAPYNPYNPQVTQAPYNPFPVNTASPTVRPYFPVNTQAPTSRPYTPYPPLVTQAPTKYPPVLTAAPHAGVGPYNWYPGKPTAAPQRPQTVRPVVPVTYKPTVRPGSIIATLAPQQPYQPAGPGQPGQPAQPANSNCHAVGIWADQPDMKDWCVNNCALGNCPADKCACA